MLAQIGSGQRLFPGPGQTLRSAADEDVDAQKRRALHRGECGGKQGLRFHDARVPILQVRGGAVPGFGCGMVLAFYQPITFGAVYVAQPLYVSPMSSL